MMQRVRANCANPAFSGSEMLDFDPEILDFDPGTAAGDMSPKHLGAKIRGAAGGYTAGRRLKAAAAGDYEGHLAESHAAVAAGTANAQHRQHAGNSDGGKNAAGRGGKELGRRLKAAIAGDHEGHLAESLAAVAAGTANAEHRQHAGKSVGGTRSAGKKKTGGQAKGVPRPTASRTRTPATCSNRRPNNKLSAKAICFDPNCKSARFCKVAKEFIARRDSLERAAKRARNERESNSFD
eukprot:COSAG01_NODE_11385_length_1945_cov_1.295455_3_plen_238_part_00